MFTSRETKEKRSHFKNMIALALIDGDFDENEQDFLRQRGMNWGLSKKDVEQVLNNPGKVQFVIPKNPDDRIAQLYDLVVMMIADGEIRQDEMDFCQTLAAQMGFRPSDVPRVLEAIIESAREERKPSIEASAFLSQG